MSRLSTSESNIDLILNQIDLDVFSHDQFDMSAYPNELFLIDDQSVPVFVIQSGNEVYNSIKQYLSGITRHENTVSANSVVVTTNNFTPYSSGMDASTVYLITYTKNTDNISYISVGGGGSNTKQIRAETIREVDDLNI